MAGRKIKSNAPWFSHDNNMRNNKRVKALRTKFPVSGYSFWCMFLEVLCGSDDIRFERNDMEMLLLSGDLSLQDDIDEMMDFCIKVGLLQVDGDMVFASELDDRLSPMFDKRKRMRDKYEKSISDAEKQNIPISDAEITIPEEEKQFLPQTEGGNTHSIVEDSNSIEKKEEKKRIPQNEFAEDSKEEIYITKKQRKLTGKRLDTFDRFWSDFSYKKGKAEAADSWLDISRLTDKLVNEICESAKAEAINRDKLILDGGTPIFPQGWLTGRRWEDEHCKYPKQNKGHSKVIQIKQPERTGIDKQLWDEYHVEMPRNAPLEEKQQVLKQYQDSDMEKANA